MNSIYRDKGYKFNTGLKWKKSGKSFLVLKEETGEMVALNDTGAEIFELVKSEMSFDDVIKKIVEDYDVTVDDVEGDISELFSRFSELGVITVG